MKKLGLILFIIFSMAEVLAQASPDFERKMYDIYKQSYSEEVSDAEWSVFIRNINNRVYEVREGDTLWDLSVVFFGDGLYWSKIWSYNSSLTNPHLIYVGQSVQFYTGSVEEAPGVSVKTEGEVTKVDAGGEPTDKELEEPEEELEIEGVPKGFKEVKEEFIEVEVPPEAEVAAETGDATVGDLTAGPQKPKAPLKVLKLKSTRGLYPGAPKIPPPRRVVKPVLENLPTSFVDSISYDANQYDEKGLSFDLRPPVRVNPLFVASSFLYGRAAHKYPRVGTLIEAENNEKLIGLNHKVYVRSDESLKVGEILTVMGRQYKFDRNGYIGDVIEYQGMVEIEEGMGDKVYRGTIVRSISGIKGNPWVTREEIPAFDDDYAGRPNAAKLQLIGGGPDNSTRVYGQSDVVFLAGGSKKGVRVGDILGIYKRRDIRYRNFSVKRSPVPIGHVKVFRAEPDTSSAFVISSNEVIVPGDETGPPTIVEAKTTASEKKDLSDIESQLDFPTESQKAEGSLEEELSEIQ